MSVGKMTCRALAVSVLGCCCHGSTGSDDLESDTTSLLQQRLQVDLATPTTARGNRDLVFMHIPYNFGHTVEAQAFFRNRSASASIHYLDRIGGFGAQIRRTSWNEVANTVRPDGEVWGHLNPDLQVLNNVTGCPMYYSPPKYWPEALAAKYFGNKTVFGLLRDPYERLIAMARGHLGSYGGFESQMDFIQWCELGKAIKHVLKEHLSNPNKFHDLCTFVPQAEYFKGPYGVSLPVNNREFPSSVNTLWHHHGYKFHINQTDIMHVEDCPEVWAGDLDEETKSLVRQVFAEDFDLLCKYFGYCTKGENCCLYQVNEMCPTRVMQAGYKGKYMPELQ